MVTIAILKAVKTINKSQYLSIMNEAGLIVLAAGSSSRLGRPKQLLFYKDKPLIEHGVIEASKACLAPIVVVTGAFSEAVTEAIKHHHVSIIYNENWSSGMASGIVAGITRMQALDNNISRVIISVCDQPFLSAVLFKQMIDKQMETGKNIVCCSYENALGTPVLFTKKYFQQLLALKGEEGAKKILKSNMEDSTAVDFPNGGFDIDTMEDYLKLQ